MKYLLGFFMGFEILDGVISHFLIRNGLAREGNPLLTPLVGEVNFLIIKVVGAFICALILWDIYRRLPKVALIATSFIVVFCAGVVVWNSGLFLLVKV